MREWEVEVCRERKKGGREGKKKMYDVGVGRSRRRTRWGAEGRDERGENVE